MSESIAGIPATELAIAKARAMKVKSDAFDSLRYFAEGTYNLQNAGYKSLEDATRRIISRAHAECEKIIQALERKYPG